MTQKGAISDVVWSSRGNGHCRSRSPLQGLFCGSCARRAPVVGGSLGTTPSGSPTLPMASTLTTKEIAPSRRSGALVRPPNHCAAHAPVNNVDCGDGRFDLLVIRAAVRPHRIILRRWETIASVRAADRDCPDAQRPPIRAQPGDRPPAHKVLRSPVDVEPPWDRRGRLGRRTAFFFRA
jgi:hypothetical protein